ncbi:hypothetical protein [Bradyrhizobium roseum]|uniref:hypothetical protein n=1 Tax=Bradyrhizobium roseum TaxID=3056648 RepID=UPI0026137C92|nr:hypothetical protein [Bradyrhizobium roseus]WKA26388.1 hypothetical protein QUH67_22630 [Bradyrhizobium roseus]
MSPRWQTAAILALPVILANCASVVPRYDVPIDPNTGSPTVSSIVRRLKCELANLVAPGAPHEFELLTGQYEVGVQLDLTVNDTGGLAPSVSYVSGPFSFGLGAKFEQSREQFFSQKLFFSLLDLRDEIDDNEAAFRAGNSSVRLTDCDGYADTNLAGNLGIKQAVDMALGSNYLRTTATLSDQGAFGGYINFLVTKNLNSVGPMWTLTHFTGPGGLGSLSEVNTDKLTFAFAVPDVPLTAEQLAKRERARKQGRQRPVTSVQQRRSANVKAEQLLQQLQINQISNRLNTIRALQ